MQIGNTINFIFFLFKLLSGDNEALLFPVFDPQILCFTYVSMMSFFLLPFPISSSQFNSFTKCSWAHAVRAADSLSHAQDKMISKGPSSRLF